MVDFAFLLPAVRCPPGSHSESALECMMQNFVTGCTVVALGVMVLLAYSQKHHQCWNGNVLEDLREHVLTRQPCGSLSSPSM